ncbi:MAG: hypothetical protein IPF58_01385 [Saprospirales bacterium]|nr:hypothetical protein [Saprospirales bacterium]
MVVYLLERAKYALVVPSVWFVLPFMVLGDLNYFSLRAALKSTYSKYIVGVTNYYSHSFIIYCNILFFNTYNPIYLHWITLCVLPWLFSLIPIYKHFVKPAQTTTNNRTVSYNEILVMAFPMLLTYIAFFN